MIPAIAAGVAFAGVAGGMLVSPRRKLSNRVTIGVDAATLYPLVASLKDGWSRWSPMATLRPGMTFEFDGPDAGVGSSQKWRGRAGTGSIIIVEADPNRRIVYETEMGIAGIKANGRIELENDGDATRVTWVDEMVVGNNPVVRWMALAMDRMRERNLELGLENLKRIALSTTAVVGASRVE